MLLSLSAMSPPVRILFVAVASLVFSAALAAGGSVAEARGRAHATHHEKAPPKRVKKVKVKVVKAKHKAVKVKHKAVKAKHHKAKARGPARAPSRGHASRAA